MNPKDCEFIEVNASNCSRSILLSILLFHNLHYVKLIFTKKANYSAGLLIFKMSETDYSIPLINDVYLSAPAVSPISKQADLSALQILI